MKNFKNLIILFLFFIIMLILTVVRTSKEKRVEKKSIFEEINLSKITSIELMDSKRHFIITNGNEWRIIFPFKELASIEKVQKLFTELKRLKIIYTITNVSKIEEYGFSPYVLRIRIQGENIDEIVDLGLKSIDEKYRYLYYKKNIYVIDSDIEFMFDIDSFRDTTIFDINVDNIDSVTIVNRTKNYKIYKKGDNYYLNEKVLSNFNQKMIDIYSLSVYDFLDIKVNKKPIYEIKLCGTEKTNLLWIYDNDIEGKWLAKSSEKNGFFLIENDDLEHILTIEEK